MLINWSYNDLLGKSDLTAVAGEYDAVPEFTSLVTDWVPYRPMAADLVALAGALAFKEYLSGELQVTEAVTPMLASALRSLCSPVDVVVHPVAYAPRLSHTGSTVLAVNPGGSNAIQPSTALDAARIVDLRIVESGRASGVLFEPLENRITVPSNAWLLGRGPTDRIGFYLPYISIAILMAQDINAGVIQVPSSVETDEMYRRVSSCLVSVGLTLQRG